MGESNINYTLTVLVTYFHWKGPHSLKSDKIIANVQIIHCIPTASLTASGLPCWLQVLLILQGPSADFSLQVNMAAGNSSVYWAPAVICSKAELAWKMKHINKIHFQIKCLRNFLWAFNKVIHIADAKIQHRLQKDRTCEKSKLGKVFPERFRFCKVLEMDFKMLTKVRIIWIEQRRITFATETT